MIKIDELLEKLQASYPIGAMVVKGPPKCGKTTQSLKAALVAARWGWIVLYVSASSEMGVGKHSLKVDGAADLPSTFRFISGVRSLIEIQWLLAIYRVNLLVVDNADDVVTRDDLRSIAQKMNCVCLMTERSHNSAPEPPQ